MALKTPKVALIDVSSLVHRAYHALPPMSTKDGTPTNAAYGFTTMLLKMFSALEPTHVVAAFDVKGPTFRVEEYKEYKAHRKATPEDLIEQFDLVRDILRAFDIPMLEKRGFEADDVIGTLVSMIGDGARKVIVTGDMDALQLVDETTSVFMLRRGISDTVLYTEEKVREAFGFDPPYIVDYKGLRGDPSDNIPGVSGIGEKTAKDLVSTYKTIDVVYEHLDDVSKRARTRLEGHKEEALLSRRLASIRKDVPLQFSLSEAALDGYDTEKVRQIFGKMDFRSLLNRLPAGGIHAQPTLFQNAQDESMRKDLPSHYAVVEESGWHDLIRELEAVDGVVAFDTETDHLGARAHPVIGMSFAAQTNAGLRAWYVPITLERVQEWKSFFENDDIKKTGHNLKYDMEVLMQSDVELRGVMFDSMIAAYLLNPGGRQYGLDALAATELGHHTIPLSDLIGKGGDQKKLSQVPLQDLARYACEDAEVSLRLYEHLSPRIRESGLSRVLDEIEIPLISVLARMEMNGIAMDTSVLSRLRDSVNKKMDQLKKDIWDSAGEEFNINSTKQLRTILFEKLQLPTANISKTQSGYSTAASELELLRGEHPIIEYLFEWRELSKLLNTYIDVLPGLADPKTGRIYASFNQTVTATGRLSSSDPNLQNIPIRSSLGQEIRRAFVAQEDCVLVKADYSQLELRIAAHMSQDEKLIDAFRSGQDIHASTAAWVYGISLEEVSDAQRREAKTLNFGILYGMGPVNFARAAGVSVEEAKSFFGRYKEEYVRLMLYIDETIAFAKEHEYVETMFGRRRYIPEIQSRSPFIASQAERMAFNFPIQGTEADILKMAMIQLDDYMRAEYPGARMVLTVHDELVCEVARSETDAFSRAMKRIMEGVTTLDVPLTVDVSAGENWRDVH